jgi:hypothetical protein
MKTNKIKPLFHTTDDSEIKWTNDMNEGTGSIKLLDKNISERLCDEGERERNQQIEEMA